MNEEERPVIVVDLAGEIVEMNQAAEATFPTLPDQGMDHPVLRKAPEWLSQIDGKGSVEDEVFAGGQRYVVQMVYDPDVLRFRFIVRQP